LVTIFTHYLYTSRLTQNVKIKDCNHPTIIPGKQCLLPKQNPLFTGLLANSAVTGKLLSLHFALDAICKDKGLQSPYHHHRQTMFTKTKTTIQRRSRKPDLDRRLLSLHLALDAKCKDKDLKCPTTVGKNNVHSQNKTRHPPDNPKTKP